MLVAPLLLLRRLQFPYRRFIPVESRCGIGTYFNRYRKKRGEFVDQGSHGIRIDPGFAGVGLENHFGTGFTQVVGVRGREGLCGVGAFGLPFPDHGGGVGRLSRTRVNGD